MNGVIGMTELALGTSPHPTSSGITCRQSEPRPTPLLTVINDILDFSKIEAGKLDLECVQFNILECIGEALKAISPSAHAKGLELLFDPDLENEMVVGDPDRLRQIILNLAGNAVKFTASGDIVVSVKVESRSESDVTFHFQCSDTGIGIPQEKQQLIFDPFAQADTSSTRKFGGTGLGLTIVNRLVGMMGGRIWVKSRVGEGSTFYFTAKFGLTGSGALGDLSDDIGILRGLPVLVVDDNLTNRRILDRVLRSWGMLPELAASGREALDLVAARAPGKEPFSLILMDQQMPEVDGFMVIDELRKQRRRRPRNHHDADIGRKKRRRRAMRGNGIGRLSLQTTQAVRTAQDGIGRFGRRPERRPVDHAAFLDRAAAGYAPATHSPG